MTRIQYNSLIWVQDNSDQNQLGPYQLGPHKTRPMPTRPKMQNSAHANSAQFKFYIYTTSYVYLERDRGSGPPPPPLKNQKNIASSSNTGPDSMKNRSYQDTIQCWAIIGTPAKRHLMAFCWWADDDPLGGTRILPPLIN